MSTTFRVFGKHEKNSRVKVIVHTDSASFVMFGTEEIVSSTQTIRQIAPENALPGQLAELNQSVEDGDEVEASAFTLVENES